MFCTIQLNAFKEKGVKTQLCYKEERGLIEHRREQKMIKCCDASKIVHK